MRAKKFLHTCPQTKCKKVCESVTHQHTERVHLGIFESSESILIDTDCQLVKSLHLSPTLCKICTLRLAWCVYVCVTLIVRAPWPTPEAFYLSRKVSGCISHTVEGHVFPCLSHFTFVLCHFSPHFSLHSTSFSFAIFLK